MNIQDDIHWTYMPPTKTGAYLCTYGDMVTLEDLSLEIIYLSEGIFMTEYKDVRDMGCKWAYLGI